MQFSHYYSLDVLHRAIIKIEAYSEVVILKFILSEFVFHINAILQFKKVLKLVKFGNIVRKTEKVFVPCFYPN